MPRERCRLFGPAPGTWRKDSKRDAVPEREEILSDSREVVLNSKVNVRLLCRVMEICFTPL